MVRPILILLISLLSSNTITATEYHVSVNGNDNNDGTAATPLRTISAASYLAHPGDIVIVHEGVYRERVSPPWGGKSDSNRITYMAAKDEIVTIKGSEEINNWVRFSGDVWKTIIPNSFFGDYNPYKVEIAGDWFNDVWKTTPHTGEVYINGKSLYEVDILEKVLNPSSSPRAGNQEESKYTWYCESDELNTYIYANFHDLDPNKELAEINVRQACFYPDTTGINYITVKNFRMSQAATQWAPPTAEQIGLLGTNWSKGWIIENNLISDSKCSGITLGKYGDEWDNKSANTANGYVQTIERALANGWNKENIGRHIVRNNTIFNCEQTGICGSLGAVFSIITGNHIYNIYKKRLFGGAEIAGIKIHASIDMVISNNCIHDACRGIWMDWMAQGTRISSNVCFNNDNDDIYFEVNHGPYVVDNNVFLSKISLRDMSQGGAYAHNIFLGKIIMAPDQRKTPFHKPHSTELAGYRNIVCGDNRFYNNIFAAGYDSVPPISSHVKSGVAYGLVIYNFAELPTTACGNVYYQGSKPFHKESGLIVQPDFNPRISIESENGSYYLKFKVNRGIKSLATKMITSEILGKAIIPDQIFENPDGTLLKIDSDFSGNKRNERRPVPGPFENLREEKTVRIKLFP